MHNYQIFWNDDVLLRFLQRTYFKNNRSETDLLLSVSSIIGRIVKAQKIYVSINCFDILDKYYTYLFEESTRTFCYNKAGGVYQMSL